MNPQVGRAKAYATCRTTEGVFLVTCGLLFATSIAVTIALCAGMSKMPETPMPGGWTLSMAWTGMPGQGWLILAGWFFAMWMAMMTAMMLPALVPTLWRYRGIFRGSCQAPWRFQAFVALGYFCVWAALGGGVFLAGELLVAVELRLPALSQAVPVLTGIVVLAAGAHQFSRFKSHHLACCRTALRCEGSVPTQSRRPAWITGLDLGAHCAACCAGLTTVLLVIGVMEARAMILVTLATTWERLAPSGPRAARVIGVGIMGTGCLLLARASGIV